ncbi:MAG: LCP family protein [Coriobacteriia bacterium]
MLNGTSAYPDSAETPLEAGLVRKVWFLAAVALVAALCTACLLLALASGVNWLARWNAERHAGSGKTLSSAADATQGKGNLLVIGYQDGVPTGFLAMKVDAEKDRVVGIAFPVETLIEVPGRGLSRLGDAYSFDATGSARVMSAVSNYLGVPFKEYVAVPGDAYSKAVNSQGVPGLLGKRLQTSLSASERVSLADKIDSATEDNTVIAPLPVNPIDLGSETYLQPDKSEVAKLVLSWWGVDMSDTSSAARVLIYNGSGEPGIAGIAAQQLIDAGYRVVDTKNADTFNYEKTQVVVQSGATSAGEGVAKALGVGEVTRKPADQDVAEIIVIIGKDYSRPSE